MLILTTKFYKLIWLQIVVLSICINLGHAAYRAPVWSENGMVATPHWLATEAAIEILEAGGNAVDAVVAASFVLAVVEPYHSGLGGGEFTLLRMATDKKVKVLDSRESAPAASSVDMFIDQETGKVLDDKSWKGGMAAGVPGSVKGRVELRDKFGAISLKEIIAPAVRLAEKGFRIDDVLARSIRGKANSFAENKDISSVFLKNSQPLKRGEILVQSNLAKTLKQISRDNGNSFYFGDMAASIIKSCKEAGGIMSIEDLAEYSFLWREPVQFNYRGYDIYSMPPPSSGGVCLAQIMNVLEQFPMKFLGAGSAQSSHLIASSFELAFADRAKWLGDPAYSVIPTEGLTSKDYALKISKNINPHYRTRVEEAGDPWIYDDDGNTSHISAIDQYGNMCSMTTSVNSSFGSQVYVPDLGFFLNSTMDDFAINPGNANYFDLVGGEVNSIAAGKRPLSSMSPTLVLRDGQPFLSIGSVGGPKIITSVAQILINVIDYEMDIQAAIDAPRVHMQWKPDKLYIEREVPSEIVLQLKSFGWNTEQNSLWSLSQGVMFKYADGAFFGASDARGVGSAGPAGDR